jgi:hypothetical protein
VGRPPGRGASARARGFLVAVDEPDLVAERRRRPARSSWCRSGPPCQTAETKKAPVGGPCEHVAGDHHADCNASYCLT